MTRLNEMESTQSPPYPYEDILVPWMICALFLVGMQCFLCLFETACDILEQQRQLMTYTDLPQETEEASTQTRSPSPVRRRLSFS